jgi:NTE family protein/lysophospholipid hydrolase
VPSSKLRQYLASHDLFRLLGEGALDALEEELQPLSLSAAEVLFRQGEGGDCLYLLTEGRLAVKMEFPGRPEVAVSELAPGETVGELSLLTGQRRTATVYALERSRLVRLSRAGFDNLADRHPGLVEQFAQSVLPRLRYTRLMDVLTSLLGDVDPAVAHNLQAELQWVHLDRGEILFQQGDPGDALYIVVHGRLRISAADATCIERVIGEVGAGEAVGDFALLTGDDRTATVSAVRDTDLVRLSRESFDNLLERHPAAIIHITRLTFRRHRRFTDLSAGERLAAMTVALVPLHRDLPVAVLAERLAEALGSLGMTLRLDADRVDRLYGKPGVAQTPEDHATNLVLSAWLSEREHSHSFIVYEAELDETPWTRRCLRRADCLLLVAGTGFDPVPDSREMALRRLAPQARAELVLLHSKDTPRPQSTSAWLAQRQVAAHHHVRLSLSGDVERLARRLAGQAHGLVLSGGGVRGFGHVGAIRAIEEMGWPIDIVGGTSMGALMGGMHALGLDHDQVVQTARTATSSQAVMDYTLPLVSLFRTRKLSTLLVQWCQGAHIEDLWIPFFCVSSNLTRGREEIHRRGPLWEAIRASLAIPGAFAPVSLKGDLLADGGSINNFPVDVMREWCGRGPVIGIDASPCGVQDQSYELASSVSGWQVLWRRLNPLRPPMEVPSILHTITRAQELSSAHRSAANGQLADLVVTLPVHAFATLDFGPWEQICEIGYTATRRCLEEWEQS